MIPVEVTWSPTSNNATDVRGMWIDTISMPSKNYTDGTWEHKAIIVDFERNTINIIALGKIRTLNGFAWDDDEAEAPASPRPINLYGRQVNIRRRAGEPS